MHLLIFIYSLHSGGAERVASNLANHWSAQGWQVTIVTLTSVDSDFYQLHPTVKRIGLEAAQDSDGSSAAVSNNLRRILALRKVLHQVRPDVALAMMTVSNILLALASIGMRGLVTVGSEHIYPPMLPTSRPWTILRSKFYGKLDAVTALTGEAKTWLQEHTSARLIPVIPNAIPWPLPAQDPIIAPPPHLDYWHTMLAVGRLDQQKGFDLLIPAFAQLAHDFPSWRLIILGEGAQRSALEAQVQVFGLGDRISLPGRAGNMSEWYEAADLYVMSSRFEGFPNTLVEAMAHGLPAISFDCDTGPRDIIRNELDGLLVSAADAAALTVALRRVMSNQTEREQWGARAREVRERFSMQRVTASWETLFQELRRAA